MKQWYALKSKPKREASAAAQLSRAGIEVYVPQVRVDRPRGQPPALEPFFPGYLFGRLDPHQGEIRLASYTSGILYVLGYGNEPWPVPDDLVRTIQERLARNRGRLAQPQYRPGDRLVITSGPLRDTEVIFDCRLSAAGRVRVLVRMLERLCRTEVDLQYLRPAPRAVGVGASTG